MGPPFSLRQLPPQRGEAGIWAVQQLPSQRGGSGDLGCAAASLAEGGGGDLGCAAASPAEGGSGDHRRSESSRNCTWQTPRLRTRCLPCAMSPRRLAAAGENYDALARGADGAVGADALDGELNEVALALGVLAGDGAAQGELLLLSGLTALGGRVHATV